MPGLPDDCETRRVHATSLGRSLRHARPVTWRECFGDRVIVRGRGVARLLPSEGDRTHSTPTTRRSAAIWSRLMGSPRVRRSVAIGIDHRTPPATPADRHVRCRLPAHNPTSTVTPKQRFKPQAFTSKPLSASRCRADHPLIKHAIQGTAVKRDLRSGSLAAASLGRRVSRLGYVRAIGIGARDQPCRRLSRRREWDNMQSGPARRSGSTRTLLLIATCLSAAEFPCGERRTPCGTPLLVGGDIVYDGGEDCCTPLAIGFGEHAPCFSARRRGGVCR